MTTLEVTCRRCGEAFTPAPEDFRRGTWRWCPACRPGEGTSGPQGGESPGTGEMTPAGYGATIQRVRARRGRQHRAVLSWWDWWWKWWNDRRRRSSTPRPAFGGQAR